MTTVLVTGALGLVGSALVRRLLDAGRTVVATDLDVPANRRRARSLPRSPRLAFRWADLTDEAEVDALVAEAVPDALVHLAAVIPPLCYARRDLARRVNVDATGSLVRAAAALASPPRFVLASSVAVYGARNPHRHRELLTALTPVAPCDLYGSHKVEAEAAVTSSPLDWVILRLGGVLTPQPRPDAGLDMLYFEALLPVDGRIQTVDVRDVAVAFDAATTTRAGRQVFLVGGDESHRVSQGDLGPAIAGAMGLQRVLPGGRRGDPASDGDWFTTDFMDTARSQEVLGFQRHTLPDLLAETRRRAGWRRWPARTAAPLVRAVLRSRSPYAHAAGTWADPWGRIRRRWGDPAPDGA